MAHNLREKRPVSYAEKPLFVLPRKKKTKNATTNSIRWKVADRRAFNGYSQ